MRIGDEAVAYDFRVSSEYGRSVVGEATSVLQVAVASERDASWLETGGGVDRLIAEMICPTCLISAADDLVGLDDEWATLTPASCPTCGQASIEWALAEATTTVLRDMLGLERLDAAIQALETD